MITELSMTAGQEVKWCNARVHGHQVTLDNRGFFSRVAGCFGADRSS